MKEDKIIKIDEQTTNLLQKQKNLSMSLKAALGEVFIRAVDLVSEAKNVDRETDKIFNLYLDNNSIERKLIKGLNLDKGEITLKNEE